MKKKNGITLIALIITIIVLLILAGVTINMVLGDNGLINKSKNAVGSYKNEQTKENTTLAEFENELDKYMGGSSGTPITSLINATNAADHIGEYIDLGTNLINKTGTTHKADWRIFDADETGVYAILAGYLPNNLSGMPSEIVASSTNVWTVGINLGPSEDDQIVSIFTMPSNWNFIVSTTSPLRGHITGGPTYQQFAKSWNKINRIVKEMDETTPSNYVDLIDGIKLYIDTDTSVTNGYWLGTVNSFIWMAGYYDYTNGCIGSSGAIGYNNASQYCLRPLAHLTSEIKVTGQDANGVWHIAQ